jgi:ribosomal protein S18 acetylase RimI-like enzyme
LISYRPYRNTDPPLLAKLWNTAGAERGLAPGMSAAQFEQIVVSKPYFEREGLVLACDGGQPVGFAHAGFGASEDQHGLDRQLGVTSMLMVAPSHRRQGIGRRLLELAEEYLRGRGAQVLYFGGVRPLDPFYVGLYGGSELPGVLDSPPIAGFCQSNSYQAIDQTAILHGGVEECCPAIDRKQLLLRRSTNIEEVPDPPAATWWEACTFGDFFRVRFELRSRDGAPLATALFWDQGPLAARWGVPTVGLTQLETAVSRRREGIATALLSEAFRRLGQQGYRLIEVQTMAHNTAALALYGKLGFQQIDRGTVYRKS